MNKGKITSLGLAILLFFTPVTTLGHSGRTDSSGGHKDNQNKSGLGGYHYHHGAGPHLHKNGVCPYTVPTNNVKIVSSTSTVKSSSVSSSKIELNKKIQTRLNELGYNCGQVDGSIGPKTIAAVKAFQKDYGLTVDGSAGPKTQAALGL